MVLMFLRRQSSLSQKSKQLDLELEADDVTDLLTSHREELSAEDLL